MTELLNRRWLSYALASVCGLVVAGVPTLRTAAFELLFASASTLTTVMVSLLGFTIAALAIVISLHDKGLVVKLQRPPQPWSKGKERPGAPFMWDRILGVFGMTAKGIGVAAMAFFVTSLLEPGSPEWWGEAIYAFLFTTLLSVSVFQLAKLIVILEAMGLMASRSS